MPPEKVRGRFLLRGSLLLIGLLTLWWLLLLKPMVFLLRATAETVGSVPIAETPTGDWSIHFPLEVETPTTKVHSVDFDLARADINAFTFSLPLFWAIILAAQGIRRNLWPLFTGTMVIAALEIALFFAFVETGAHRVAGDITQSQTAGTKWFLHFAEYMIVTVIPYVAPFLTAIALHRELRTQLLNVGATSAAPAPR
jgi:hypothetical protein